MAGQSSSSIRFSCPSCGGRVKVPPGQAGEKCRCPRCDVEVIAPAAAPEKPRSVDPYGDDDFFMSDDETRQQTARPVITLDDEFATPLGPPPAPSLPKAELAKPPEHKPDSAGPDYAPVSPGDAEAIELLPVDDAPVELPQEARDVESAKDRPTATAGHARKAATPRHKKQQSEQFGVVCGLCGTRIYATPDQVGQELTCPDCHSKVPIRAPKVRKKSPPPPPPDDDDDEDTFRLSELEERPQSDYLQRASQALAAGAGAAAGDGASEGPPKRRASESGKPTGLNLIADQARSVLAKAKAEMEEAERSKAKLPDRPFVTGMISFLFDVRAATRWLVLTFLLQGALSILAMAADHDAGALLMMPVAVFLFLFLWTAPVCYLAILQDTANGYDMIEQWPGVNVIEWMGEAFYVINAFFASATPGVLFGVLLTCGGVPKSFAFFFVLVSFFTLFPVFLLSMVEEGSPLSIASSAIWRSLLVARPLWIKFYLFSLGIAFAALMGMVIAVAALKYASPAIGFVLCGVAIAFVIAVTMVYFRLLGRLAWCLSELDRQRPKPD